MAQDYTLMDDIVTHHTQRMQNLKQYYPYFRLAKGSLDTYKDGRYAGLDMGYMVLAVLRFFIEENHFKEAQVTYPMYHQFMKDFLEQEYKLAMTEEESGELIQYIFDKLCNDGRPFIYSYYDPEKKAQVQERIKYIDSRFEDDILVYFITGDGIEFYLDTKEVKDESKITAEQLLLEKMIRANNFRGALDVVRRINGEVGKLKVRKDEVLRLLTQNVFQGFAALDEFSKNVLAWFKEEQRLFSANKELVDRALLAAQNSHPDQDRSDRTRYTMEEIYALDRELKRAIRRHGELLSACTQLQVQADELIQRAKSSRLRHVFSFDDFLERMVDRDDASALGALVRPLADMNLHKTLNLYQLDAMLDFKPDDQEKGEKAGAGKEQMYVYEDEKIERRIETNYDIFLKVLFEQLQTRGSFDLKFLNHMYEMKFTDNILKNGDYFSFIVHLSQKSHYDLGEIRRHQDTFLEGIISAYVKKKEEDGQADGIKDLVFDLKFMSDDLLTLSSGAQISNIYFSAADRREH